MSNKRDRMTRRLAACGLAAAGILTAGCSVSNTYSETRHNQYMAHRDSLTLGAGDAKESNRVVQTVDPWPPYSANRRLTADGQRMDLAVTRYKENNSIEPVSPLSNEKSKDPKPSASPSPSPAP